MKHIAFAGTLGLLAGLGLNVHADPAQRDIPRPLPSHPGNIFLADEAIHMPAPAGDAETWRVINYDGKTIGEGHLNAGQIELDHLPVGYYELVGSGSHQSRHISLGVLEPLHAPTPLTSPIGMDVALAWCFPVENMTNAVSLCTLAGMNRVRDRLMWGEMEPKPGQFASSNRYDYALQVQGDARLKVLQVSHVSASWANPNSKHVPLDLRDTYRFYREMARRWRGKIEAFEPWNEGDITEFGGHTGNELASLQKAAYFGLKAGNPDLIICDNVFGIHRQTTLRNFNDNKAWPYFDTFNLHHYEPFAKLPKLYSDFREISAGKPMWVTECNITVNWSGDENLKEPDAENLRIQSERVAKIYSEGIHEGAQAVFYFMLPHYVERQLQYGLLHPDLTPRPAFVAAAAAGRLLADAKPLGRVDAPDKSIQGFLFHAKPDGKPADILVIWSDAESEFQLAKPATACFDQFGREHPLVGNTLKLNPAPLYVILPDDARPKIIPPPSRPELLTGTPCPIVLQCLLAETNIALIKSAYKIPASSTNDIPIYVYNFGDHKIQGKLQVTVPDQWTAQFPQTVEIEPGNRKELTLKLGSVQDWTIAARVRITGNFGDAGEQTLALRFAKIADAETK